MALRGLLFMVILEKVFGVVNVNTTFANNNESYWKNFGFEKSLNIVMSTIHSQLQKLNK